MHSNTLRFINKPIQQLFTKMIRISSNFRYCGKYSSEFNNVAHVSQIARHKQCLPIHPRQHLFYILFLTIISEKCREEGGRNSNVGGEIFCLEKSIKLNFVTVLLLLLLFARRTGNYVHLFWSGVKKYSQPDFHSRETGLCCSSFALHMWLHMAMEKCEFEFVYHQ